MTPGRLRLATEADLPSIAALDQACFGNPWTQEIYRQELSRPFGRLVVLDDHGPLLGLSCTWIVGEEAHLLRIATSAEHRRRGVGRRLLDAAIEQAIAAGCRVMLLEVAAANRPARGLYDAFGFHELSRRIAYYKHPPDDAVVMRRHLLEDTVP